MSLLVSTALALAAALALYLASPHQRLLRRLPPRGLRLAAAGLLSIALALAGDALGFTAGLFSVLSALMLGCVALPFINLAWGRRDVG